MQIPDNPYQFARWVRAELAQDGDAFLYRFWAFLYEKQKEGEGKVTIIGGIHAARDVNVGREAFGGSKNVAEEHNQ